MFNKYWTETEHAECEAIAARWVSLQATENNPAGLDAIQRQVVSHLKKSDFQVERIVNPEALYRPLIVAKRESNSGGPWLGFFGHYDVEPAETGEWSYNPWQLTDVDGRWGGRGVGDNLVPLAQRLVLFKHLDSRVNLACYLQGEEEIGSPFATKMYATFDVSNIALWVEETGYFYTDGRQRFLIQNNNKLLRRVLGELQNTLVEVGRTGTVLNRPLNKAHGNDRCPCLKHLLREIPYLAIGPNDDHFAVHGSDESIDPGLLPLCALQLNKVAEVLISG